MKNIFKYGFLYLLVLCTFSVVATEISLFNGPTGGKLIDDSELYLRWNTAEALNGQDVYFAIKFYQYDTAIYDSAADFFENLSQDPMHVETTEVFNLASHKTYFAAVASAYFIVTYPDLHFAWKIEAYKAESEELIAESSPFYFQGRAIIPQIFVEDNELYVLYTNNTDLDNLSGVAYIEDVLYEFSNFKIDTSTYNPTLIEGEALSMLETPVALHFDNQKEKQGEFTFYHYGYKLSPSGNQALGTGKWVLPDPFSNNGVPYVLETDTVEVDTEYGGAGVEGSILFYQDSLKTSIEDYVIHLDSTSVEIFTNGDFFTPRFRGSLEVPFGISSNTESTLKFPIQDMWGVSEFSSHELQYYETIFAINIFDNNQIPSFTLFNSSTIRLYVTGYVIDFSDEESPREKASDPAWKGVYFTGISFIFPQDINSNELTLNNDYLINHEYHMESDFLGWIDTAGFHFKHDEEEMNFEGKIHPEQEAKVNNFSVHYQANQLQSPASLSGTVKIDGVCSYNDRVNFSLPIIQSATGPMEYNMEDQIGPPCIVYEFVDSLAGIFKVVWEDVPLAIGYELALSADYFNTFLPNYDSVFTEGTGFTFTNIPLNETKYYQYRLRIKFPFGYSEYRIGYLRTRNLVNSIVLEDLEPQINLFPNPVNRDMLKISIVDPSLEIKHIKIIASNGLILYNKKVEQFQHEIKVPFLPNWQGVLMIEVVTNKGVIRDRLVRM